LVGIVTDRDLALKVVADGRDPKAAKVEEVMTRNVVTCRPEDDLQKALDAMSEHQLRRIPVVDDGNKLVGIIAQADVATRVNQPQKTAETVEGISQSSRK
jgi:CBS domain-containing protein